MSVCVCSDYLAALKCTDLCQSERPERPLCLTILPPRNHNELSHYHAQNEMKMFLVEMKFEETYVQILQEIL